MPSMTYKVSGYLWLYKCQYQVVQRSSLVLLTVIDSPHVIQYRRMLKRITSQGVGAIVLASDIRIVHICCLSCPWKVWRTFEDVVNPWVQN